MSQGTAERRQPESPSPMPPVRLSACADLFLALTGPNAGDIRITGTKPPVEVLVLLAAPPALLPEIRGFWQDGVGWWLDVFVLADQAGYLDGAQPRMFLGRLEEIAARSQPVDSLRLEHPRLRLAVAARLARLRRDPVLRRRYAGVVRETWRRIEPLWTSLQPELESAASQVRDQLSRSDHPAQVIPTGHVALRHFLRRTVCHAAADGALEFVCCAFGQPSGGIYDAPGRLIVSLDALGTDKFGQTQHQAQLAAGQLSALAEPTRLQILAHLAWAPASIADLAKAFGLAQPTISVHVRTLRNQGLVQVDEQGGHGLYVPSADGIDRLLGTVRSLLLANQEPSLRPPNPGGIDRSTQPAGRSWRNGRQDQAVAAHAD